MFRSYRECFACGVATVALISLGCTETPDVRQPSSPRFVRDSMVQDSVARTIDADSIVALYVALMRSPGDTVIEQEISCEHFRLIWRHGGGPAGLATTRVADSLATAHGEVWSRFNEGGHASSFTEAGPDRCGVADEPQAPPFIGTTTTGTLYEARP